MTDTERDHRVAEVVRAACVTAAQASYERDATDGLCDGGAWEAAIDAVRSLDVDAILLELKAEEGAR